MNIVNDLLFKKIFPLFNISDFSINGSSNKITLYLEPSAPPVCPHCKSHKVVVHEYRKRTVRDDKFFGYAVILIITYRTTKCLYCDNYGTEKVSFISDNARVTKRLENTVIDDLERAGSIKDTVA